jgi:type II secretory pathway predicted ATPase ExeA
MNINAYYGFKHDPFSSEIQGKNLLKLPSMVSVKERFDYLQQGGVFVVTGDVGSGKSTSLRWSMGQYHPSQYLFLNVIGTGGSLVEFYRQVCWELDIEISSGCRTGVIKKFKSAIKDIATTKKQKVMIVVDEAHLLRSDLFAELHILSQYENDSKNYFSIVLAGLPSLLDKLTLRSSAPLASRVVTRTHLTNLSQEQMKIYVEHHLSVAGIKSSLFADAALTAIYQGSGGILRRANLLARGGLVAACIEKSEIVSAEHIRIASSELM